MKKKNWSFILAFVLSIGLGFGSIALADPYAAERTATEAQLAAQTGSTGVFTITPTPEQEAVIGNTENKIAMVFNYKAGILTHYMDKDRNVVIFDSGKPRATLGYNDDGTFTVIDFQLSGSDWDEIAAMPGSTEAEKLKNFLIASGVDPDSLKKTGTDSDGNVQNGANNGSFVQEDVEWLAVAAAKLKQGVNYSLSINLSATYGASMTWSVNGKQQQTIAYDGEVVQQFHYNAEGTLETITQTNYESQISSGTGTTTFTKSVTTVHLNAAGKQDYITNSDGTTVATFEYYNGSLISYHSNENNETTYYKNQVASYVLNDQGFKTAEYTYHANGSLDGITSFNFDEDATTNTPTETTITAYKWGRAVGSADLSSGQGVRNFDQLRQAVADIKANPNAVLANIRAGAAAGTDANTSIYSNITSIALYESDLDNTALMSFLGISNANRDKMRSMSNGYSSVGSASFVYGSINAGTRTTNVFAPDGTTINGTFYDHGDSVTISEGQEGINLTVNLTVNDRGGSSYSINATKEYTIKAAVQEVVARIDPAVRGTVTGTTVIDGKTYLVVSASEVNMMDGEGFQSGEGETVYVEVTDESMLDLVGQEALFMGDVTSNSEGKLTMAVNEDYSGGVKTGADIQATQDARQNEQLDWVVANTYGGSFVGADGATKTVDVGNKERLQGYLGEWVQGWNYLANNF